MLCIYKCTALNHKLDKKEYSVLEDLTSAITLRATLKQIK